MIWGFDIALDHWTNALSKYEKVNGLDYGAKSQIFEDLGFRHRPEPLVQRIVKRSKVKILMIWVFDIALDRWSNALSKCQKVKILMIWGFNIALDHWSNALSKYEKVNVLDYGGALLM